ncbi:TPA: hypothetical protein EYP38_01950, partial [Candidatus Micrarchaeota archaeon]|nr:hypothetical protein [Candidatus Micrarchaeota archaeon]
MDLTKIFGLCAVILLVFGAVTLVTPEAHAEDQPSVNLSLNKFSSCSALGDYIKEKGEESGYGRYGLLGATVDMIGAPVAMESADANAGGGSKTSSDYSGTNVQVEGVDEADMVKTDGKYLYILTGTRVVIVDAYPAESAEKLSEIETGIHSSQMFVNGDKLILFGSHDYQDTSVRIYDISDRENPELEEKLVVDGYYVNSRMIGDYVYLIASEPTYHWVEGGVPLPAVKEDSVILGNVVSAPSCGDVYYFDDMPEAHSFTTVVSIDLDGNDVSSELFVTGSAEDMYMSQDSIYLVYTSYGYEPTPEEMAVQTST